MTTVAVLADPPVEGVVLPELVAADILTEAEAVTLYEAMLTDTVAAVAGSGAELLINYRDGDQLAAELADPEAQIRSAIDTGGPVEARYEVQVGSTHSARIGNTVTHLLETEEVATAAVVDPEAVLLARTQIDSAAMKLRGSEVVIAPAGEGRVAYAGFRSPIDFSDAFDGPALETICTRAADADLDIDFLPVVPRCEQPRDISTVGSLLRARAVADRRRPKRTARVFEELELGA
jgi:2-phospho-L-lactate guanylyltransferase (CobY/MobA/RfbA family)